MVAQTQPSARSLGSTPGELWRVGADRMWTVTGAQLFRCEHSFENCTKTESSHQTEYAKNCLTPKSVHELTTKHFISGGRASRLSRHPHIILNFYLVL